MESCAHPNHLISVTEMFISEFIKNLQEDYKKSNPRFTTYLYKYGDQLQILKGLTIHDVGKRIQIREYMSNKDKKLHNIVNDDKILPSTVLATYKMSEKDRIEKLVTKRIEKEFGAEQNGGGIGLSILKITGIYLVIQLLLLAIMGIFLIGASPFIIYKYYVNNDVKGFVNHIIDLKDKDQAWSIVVYTVCSYLVPSRRFDVTKTTIAEYKRAIKPIVLPKDDAYKTGIQFAVCALTIFAYEQIVNKNITFNQGEKIVFSVYGVGNSLGGAMDSKRQIEKSLSKMCNDPNHKFLLDDASLVNLMTFIKKSIEQTVQKNTMTGFGSIFGAKGFSTINDHHKVLLEMVKSVLDKITINKVVSETTADMPIVEAPVDLTVEVIPTKTSVKIPKVKKVVVDKKKKIQKKKLNQDCIRNQECFTNNCVENKCARKKKRL
jgi:hypothetical protein